jgi:hypothetical protein
MQRRENEIIYFRSSPENTAQNKSSEKVQFATDLLKVVVKTFRLSKILFRLK